MIIVLKQNAPDAQVHEFCRELEGMGLQINDSKGSDTHILGLIGDTKAIAESWVLANPVVETCRRVSEPYKKANRKFHPDDSIIDVNGVKIGGGNFAVIAGPCSIESEEQITYCAQRVKDAGASLLRGGAFKPRTSPYSFQGMRSEGLDLLKLARRATGAPIVTEIMNTEHLPLFENVDLIQVGARNMQNFELLKAVGRQKKPVLLKRGLANTLEEFVMSAEYIMAEGNENVILCERGIRTFETSMRNTLDLAGVVMLHKMTHLPVIVVRDRYLAVIRIVSHIKIRQGFPHRRCHIQRDADTIHITGRRKRCLRPGYRKHDRHDPCGHPCTYFFPFSFCHRIASPQVSFFNYIIRLDNISRQLTIFCLLAANPWQFEA